MRNFKDWVAWANSFAHAATPLFSGCVTIDKMCVLVIEKFEFVSYFDILISNFNLYEV